MINSDHQKKSVVLYRYVNKTCNNDYEREKNKENFNIFIQ